MSEMPEKIFRLSEFVEMAGISRPTFYNLVKKGQAPEFFKMGRRTMITQTAYERWIADSVSRTDQRTMKFQERNQDPATKARTG